jgi:N-acetylglucosamine kinase-like BadF-type ATPase
MDTILAMDAGGTTTRALVADRTGRVHGYGLAGSGNPVSAGLDAAMSSLVEAASRALEACAQPVSLASALIVMAGASSRMPGEQIPERLAGIGVRGPVRVESDLLGAFCSGTIRREGYALVAGTGSVAARVRAGRLDAVADGSGWLLGVAGSGYWVGHRVATAVAAALDGRGPETALTGAVLDSLGLTRSPVRADGRPQVLLDLMDELYALRPVQLSRFAPLAFQLADDDVAHEILSDAAAALTNTLAAVHQPGLDGPVVLGGGLLVRPGSPGGDHTTYLSRALATTLGDAEVVSVTGGVLGAAVLGLRNLGVEVDAELFDRLRQDLSGWTDTAEGTT